MTESITIEEFEENFKDKNLHWDGVGRKKAGGKLTIHGNIVYCFSQRYKLFVEQGYVCACCGKKGTHFSFDNNRPEETSIFHLNLRAEDGTILTKDHIIPKSAGGKDEMSNYQVLCEDCNLKKGNSLPEGYKAAGFYTDDGQYFTTLTEVLGKYSDSYKNPKAKKRKVAIETQNFFEAITLNKKCWGHYWTWNCC